MKPISIMPFDQPSGSFLLGVMTAREILEIAQVNTRTFDPKMMDSDGGVQREASSGRIAEIAQYAQTVDASFPNAIILALAPESYELKYDQLQINVQKGTRADIVDGQHRLAGLQQSGRADEFSLPVVFILDATQEQKALLFAIINGKQTKVPASIVFDLFGVTEGRSPQKSCHEIARAVNSDRGSPWHNRLKMLGKAVGGIETQSLSQGTFVRELLKHISNNPDEDRDRLKRGKAVPPRDGCVFNEYWRKNQDEVILKILLNLFCAAKEVWPSEWQSPDTSILTKSVGFTALMKALPELIAEGKSKRQLDRQFFRQVLDRAKAAINESHRTLSSEHFASEQGASALKGIIVSAIKGE